MKVSFQTIDGKHYLCAEDGGGTEQDGKGRIVADRTKAEIWEQFEPRPAGGGYWGFRSHSGAWLSAQHDGALWANRVRPDDWTPEAWEAFKLVPLADGRIALQSDHGLYVCAEGAGGGDVFANRLAINAWESFLPSQRFWMADRPPLHDRLAVQGRFFVTGGEIYRPVWASLLSILRRPHDERVEQLGALADLGFNGVRVFAGALSWANQTPAQARAVLPALLDECHAAGLRVEVVAITDSGTGYDVRAHTFEIADYCTNTPHAILELANEYWHPTQSPWVQDAANLLALRRQLDSATLMSLGAPPSDEPEGSLPLADYLTLHLDRGRDKWNMVRRVRELEGASARYGKPVLNNEPIGADEEDGRATGRQRLNDPSIFFCMGALNRIFEVGGVFHSQAGLHAMHLGPVQTECAKAFISGFSAIKTTDRLTFKNATWADSPVKNAAFDQTVIRAYSGVSGDRGWLVLVGLRGDPRVEYQGGWGPVGVVAEVSGCQVIELARGARQLAQRTTTYHEPGDGDY